MKKTILSSSLVVALSVSINGHAAMPSTAVLTINPQSYSCVFNLGTPPDGCLVGPSPTNYFSMDTNANGNVDFNEKLGIENNEGIKLGEAQPASGSHSGLPGTGGITEIPGIDKPWSFFGNTGMHQSTLAITINSDDGAGNVVLAMSGWSVDWNGVADIPLGGDPIHFSGDTQAATITCGNICEAGDTFVLEYSSHVMHNSGTDFDHVPYTLHLEGMVESGAPTTNVAVQLNGGNAQECSSPGGSLIEATADITTSDINDIASVNWSLDGVHAGSGHSVNIFTPLGNHNLTAVVDTVMSGSIQSSVDVTVSDTTAPQLNVSFMDQRSGLNLTEVSANGRKNVAVNYDVTDVCDVEPTTSGVAAAVKRVEDGATLTIVRGQLDTSAVNVSASATDASGNTSHSEAQLLIIDEYR